MLKSMIASLTLLLLAAAAQAGVIHDVRTGLVAEGTTIVVSGAVVTAVQAKSFTVTELPAGPYAAIWVYEGTEPAVAVGDVVDIKGFYRDNNGRAELNLLYPADAGVTVTGSAPVPDLQLATTELMADPEAWESAVVTITDGMIVQELLSNGQWRAQSVETGLDVIFDDYFFDYHTVALGDCYNNAYGMFTWLLDKYVFKVMSVAMTDCTVANDEVSFGQIKALYR